MKQYVELIEKDIKNRNHIVSLDKLNIKKSKHERYISHYRFGKDFADFVKKTKSVADFTGSVSIDNIWVDFDKEDDIEGARKETIKFLNILSGESGLAEDSFPTFFSGNKGFHVGISSKLIGLQDEYSDKIPYKVKKFIQLITKDIDCVDYSIYNKNRVIRLPYSINKKSGLYKIYIPYDILWGEPISNIIEYAKNCKKFKVKRKPIVVNQNLLDIFSKATKNEVETKMSLNGDATSLFSIPQNGERNNKLFKQACKLFRCNELRTDEAYDIMNIMYHQTKVSSKNKMFSKREFNTLLDSAFKSTKGNKLGDIQIKAVDNLTFDIIDEIKNSKYIPTSVPLWDKDLDGGLIKGNVYSFIGKGGTKKSLLAMWIGLKNCMENELPVAYFNMEMSTSQSFIRAFRMLFNRDIKTEVQQGDIKEEEIERLSQDFRKALKNKFYLIDNNNLTPKDMYNVLDEIEDKYNNKIELVVADSMNSMATVGGSESFTAFEITKELKQLAKDKNCVVILINHVTKGPPKHVRDVSLYVRGGEKIIDNCDAYFCLSQVVDQDKSTLVGEDKDYIYMKDIIYARLVNKRESGNTIDTIMSLGEDLVPRDTDVNPKTCEINYRE